MDGCICLTIHSLLVFILALDNGLINLQIKDSTVIPLTVKVK